MTLIIKELIIRGIVTKDPTNNKEEALDKEALKGYLEQMKQTIEKNCIETVLSKIESKKNR